MQIKKPLIENYEGLKEGGDILSHRMAVPSALLGLTSLFGKGRGVPQCNNHLSVMNKHTKIMATCHPESISGK